MRNHLSAAILGGAGRADRLPGPCLFIASQDEVWQDVRLSFRPTSLQIYHSSCLSICRRLPQYQVPEWSASYINYKGLKKLIKAAVAIAKTGRDPDLAGETSLLATVLSIQADAFLRVLLLLGSQFGGCGRIL